ncbi:uncharacterized protein EI90DRAFT_1885001 [Cantharellus anzutake]|uniref:uncharacterized protein n=1 Tax=Cantharellus anzutake TaxID=1750568 RepID=UPI001906431F|nr:uncharacterized protein EI90DRAFT_1885001 [Cantharellus anzutake]KAF8326882.1 hypothetical protein EI90DRAFT_1885001 [Cantharellus anzutake]
MMSLSFLSSGPSGAARARVARGTGFAPSAFSFAAPSAPSGIAPSAPFDFSMDTLLGKPPNSPLTPSQGAADVTSGSKVKSEWGLDDVVGSSPLFPRSYGYSSLDSPDLDYASGLEVSPPFPTSIHSPILPSSPSTLSSNFGTEFGSNKVEVSIVKRVEETTSSVRDSYVFDLHFRPAPDASDSVNEMINMETKSLTVHLRKKQNSLTLQTSTIPSSLASAPLASEFGGEQSADSPNSFTYPFWSLNQCSSPTPSLISSSSTEGAPITLQIKDSNMLPLGDENVDTGTWELSFESST